MSDQRPPELHLLMTGPHIPERQNRQTILDYLAETWPITPHLQPRMLASNGLVPPLLVEILIELRALRATLSLAALATIPPTKPLDRGTPQE